MDVNQQECTLNVTGFEEIIWVTVDFMVAQDYVSCYGGSTDNFYLGMWYKYIREFLLAVKGIGIVGVHVLHQQQLSHKMTFILPIFPL
jgi:hypothetical protein